MQKDYEWGRHIEPPMNLVKRIKSKASEVSRHFFLFILGSKLRYFKKPSFPKNKDGKVLIHIGCGDFNDKRYINIDTRPGWHIHSTKKIEDIESVFPKNFADLIYACHILEHVPYANVPQVLKKTYSRLKKGGVLRLAVPNFEVITQMYQMGKSVKDILPPLMGGQGYPDNFHYTAFDKKFLTKLLLDAGFEKVRIWDPKTAPYYDFKDWAGRTISLYGKEWPISLNVEAIK